jgi:hypothetical protein
VAAWTPVAISVKYALLKRHTSKEIAFDRRRRRLRAA